MGYPVWKTKGGDLGRIAELQFYSFNFEAVDPDTPTNIVATAAQLGRPQRVALQWNLNSGLITLNSTGLPFHGYGNPAAVNAPTVQNYNVSWSLRAGTKQPALVPVPLNLGIIGFWLNGVAMFSPSAANGAPAGFLPNPQGFNYNASYEASQELGYSFGEDRAGGHADPGGVYHYHDFTFSSAWTNGAGARGASTTSSGLAEVAVIPYLQGGLHHPDGHSKILGWSLDGYPVYGPNGYTHPDDAASGAKKMKTGYSLKNYHYRQGTAAADLSVWPMGIFIQDYEYTGTGDLDSHNGRYCVTPDYPNGTYAYFVTVDSNDRPQYPYVIGNTYYAVPTAIPTPTQRIVPPVLPNTGFGPANNLTETNNVTFSLIAGRFPPGLQIDPLGKVLGQPAKEYGNVGGVPTAVNRDRTYTFTIRAASNADSSMVSDNTFTLTVTGNQPPQLLTGAGDTPPARLGQFLDGEYIRIPLQEVDPDDTVVTWSITNGQLPPGVTMDKNGVISGTIVPFVNLPESATTGWDKSRWEAYPWEFSTISEDKNYFFTVQVSDGKFVDIKQYYIQVYSHNDLAANNTVITTDTVIFHSDQDAKRNPVITTVDLGDYSTYTSDNYFSFKFDVAGLPNANGVTVDLDGDQVSFQLLASAGVGFDTDDVHFDMAAFDRGEFKMIPGLVLNETTGWLTGYIPSQIESSITYSFAVRAYKTTDSRYISPYYTYTITILGSLNLNIDWLTPTTLPSIQAGETSTLGVSAVSRAGLGLTYTLKRGSKLPPGLIFLSDGSISGRCSFQSFSLDSGKTTFDVVNASKGITDSLTVFDKTYKFTAIATTANGSASGEKTFYLPVVTATAEPYENVYVKCLPPLAARDIYTTIIDNPTVFPASSLYRPNDPYWGKQRNILMISSYGLTASSAADYIAAMQDRHYPKKYFFGEYGVSIARDADDNILYEVIWVDVIEETSAYQNGVKSAVPPKSSLDMRVKVTGWKNPEFSPTDPAGYTLKVNDQYLLRRDLVNALGRTNSTVLPKWMSSVQKDGTVPGFVTRVPMAYVNPGEGDKVLYRLKVAAKNNVIPKIQDIPFVADRYVLSNTLSSNFDLVTKKYTEHFYTTFDNSAKIDQYFAPYATVDYATDLPFNYINGRSPAFVEALGGIDRETVSFANSTLIFAQQEQFVGYPDAELKDNEGWREYTQFFDDLTKYDIRKFDEVSDIPGYAESQQIGSNLTNKRAGIWKITIDTNGLYKLVFIKEVPLESFVRVKSGAKYGGNLLSYSITNEIPPKTVPDYQIVNVGILNNIQPTTFDLTSTQFLNNTDHYILPGVGDVYLKFPKAGIFA